MIAELPDLPSVSRKRGRAERGRTDPVGLFPKRRRARISYPTAPSPVIDMTAHIVKNELKNAGKQLVYAAMERTVAQEKQESMKTELEKSEAIPALLKHYLGGLENLPKPLQLGILLAEKYDKTLLTT